jgi:hypothetical protein
MPTLCAPRQPFRSFKSKILTACVAVAFLAAVTAAARAWLTAPALTAAPSLAAPTSPTNEAILVVRITIRPTGFDPSEVVLPRGRFVLAIDNRSGLSDLTFRLDREAGGRVREARMPREQLGWRSVIDPPPGLYVLTAAEHPEWACRIQVTN